MQNYPYDFKSHKFLGIRVFAIIETLVFLSILLLINLLFSDGRRFIQTSLHPFWIIILLTSVQYGTVEGIFATLMAILFLYIGNMPIQKAQESLFDYQLRLGFLPAIWFTMAFILGEIRMRLEWEKDSLKSNYVHAKSEVEKIATEYQVLKDTNQSLSVSLSRQEETAAISFHLFKSLIALEPAQIIFGLSNVIQFALHPKKFSVFAKGSNGLEAVTSEGWQENDAFSRRITPDQGIYQEIVENKRFLTIVNKDDRNILQKEGLLAGPLIDRETNTVFGMAKIESIDFSFFDLSRVEIFHVICQLAGDAYVNAKKHKILQQSSIWAIENVFYSHAFFKTQLPYLKKVSEKFGLILNTVLLKVHNTHSLHNFIVKLRNLLLSEIQIYEGERKNKEMYFLHISSDKNLKKEIYLALNAIQISPNEYHLEEKGLNV